jgi:hypothetical protein
LKSTHFTSLFRTGTYLLLLIGFTSVCYGKTQFADGSRVEVVERGFSLVPPVGWEVTTGGRGSSLLMQDRVKRETKYQRTLQVFTFSGGLDVSAGAAQEVQRNKIEPFGKIAGNINNFRIRNYLPVSLKDGNEALLFYSEFNLENEKMMQAHLVTSSINRHYVVTYTDLEKYFEGIDQGTSPLTKAWESMVSFRVAQKPSNSWSTELRASLAAGIVVIIGLFFVVGGLRRKMKQGKFENMTRQFEREQKIEDAEQSNSHYSGQQKSYQSEGRNDFDGLPRTAIADSHDSDSERHGDHSMNDEIMFDDDKAS